MEAVMVSIVIQQDWGHSARLGSFSRTGTVWMVSLGVEMKSSDYRVDGDRCWAKRHGN
jgi:hypothetical protein